jgi:hypothetical protein
MLARCGAIGIARNPGPLIVRRPGNTKATL